MRVIGGRLRVDASNPIEYKGPMFNPAPGFEAANLCVHPDREGRWEISLSLIHEPDRE